MGYEALGYKFMPSPYVYTRHKNIYVIFSCSRSRSVPPDIYLPTSDTFTKQM